MHDILDTAEAWLGEGLRCVLATVVNSTSSTPLPVGSSMVIAETGEVHGSVSGGCVEGAVIEAAHEVLGDGKPRLHQYGVSDADALTVGLTCGGTIEVLLSALADGAPDLITVRSAVQARRPVAIAYPLPSVTAMPDGAFAPTSVELDADRVIASAAGPLGDLPAPAADLLRCGRSGIVQLPTSQSRSLVRVFLQVFAPQPELVVFGVSSFAVATARLGRFLGFHVAVCDPRAALLTPERFPDPHDLVVEWPHRYLDRVEVAPDTVLCVLTHDAKYDLPLLERALASSAGYVGAIGSRRTDQERRQRLLQRGVAQQDLARLRSPIGLDLGSRTAEEVALSIFAEVLMLREGRDGRPLCSTQAHFRSGETVEAPNGRGAGSK